MRALRLFRDIAESDSTVGRLDVFSSTGAAVDSLFSIEKPWVPSQHGGKAGEPFRSCVGVGTYSLRPYVRPNGDCVWQLSCPDLDVYPLDTDIPSHKARYGRYLILIHIANYSRDVVGCIGPGLSRRRVGSRWMVTDSRKAMQKLHRRLDGRRGLEIEIV